MGIKISRDVDIVEGITREQFEKNYFYPQKPVVLRGLLKHCPAFDKWSLKFFEDEMGDLEVGIFDAAMDKIDRSYKEPHYRVPFREYLEEIQNGPTSKRLFLFNAFKHNRALLEDFDFPKICSGFLKSFPFMFFGGDGAVTRIHQDMDMSCVFLSQFEGKKRVVLFDPKYSKLLYRLPYNVHTAVNIEDPDYEKYPGLKYVEGHEVILKLGDTVFMPAGWWHHIKYVGPGFSMSQRCLSPHMKDRVQGGLNVGIKTHVDDILRRVIGDNWFNFKERKAFERANKALSKLDKS